MAEEAGKQLASIWLLSLPQSNTQSSAFFPDPFQMLVSRLFSTSADKQHCFSAAADVPSAAEAPLSKTRKSHLCSCSPFGSWKHLFHCMPLHKLPHVQSGCWVVCSSWLLCESCASIPRPGQVSNSGLDYLINLRNADQLTACV